jgi:hypothetical protein
MQSLRPERARALYNAGLTSVELVASEGTIEGMVHIFSQNDGFISHRKSNEQDLKIKYDYLYTLASKVSSEAKLIMVKRRVDPDRTLLSYLQSQPVNSADLDYVLDSDYSSDDEEEVLKSKLEKALDLDESIDE